MELKNTNTRNLKEMNVIELNKSELLVTNAGSELSNAFWYGVGVLCHGISVFSTEGGNNAGICVR